MSKVEEVAEAIMQAAVSGKGYHDIARAAIEVMREPTEHMLNNWYDYAGVIYPDDTNAAEEHYRSMIDAALNEQVAG